MQRTFFLHLADYGKTKKERMEKNWTTLILFFRRKLRQKIVCVDETEERMLFAFRAMDQCYNSVHTLL
jgi:hypothetical protein